MPATLVERARQVIAAENDDFFQANTILYYLNKAQRKVTSYMVQQEQEMNKSLRALDSIRENKSISVSGLTFEDNNLYYSTQVEFPSTVGEEVNQFSFVKYDARTVMRELTQNNLVKLEWGNLQPTQFESYYQITRNDSNNVAFEIYVPNDDSGSSKELKIYYVLDPTDLQLTDEELTDLPSQLENAVIYGAAQMMVMQESVKDPQSQSELFTKLYQEEIQAASY